MLRPQQLPYNLLVERIFPIARVVQIQYLLVLLLDLPQQFLFDLQLLMPLVHNEGAVVLLLLLHVSAKHFGLLLEFDAAGLAPLEVLLVNLPLDVFDVLLLA